MKNKIRDIRFIDHPILGNLYLNFSDDSGNAVDTVIFAGENGVGKSTIINAIYEILTGNVHFDLDMNVEYDNSIRALQYRARDDRIWVTDNEGLNTLPGADPFKKKYQFNSIYSDVDINFKSPDISSVTSLTLDSEIANLRSNNDLPRQTKQLLIDIQALDDAEISKAYRENPNKIDVKQRIPRFTNAFNYMFDSLKYDGIENCSNKKVIYFKKNGSKIPIDNLSSGEKQIVYRGCFMLKDVDSLNGAFVFIDEPEISLHPNWQKKILDYYKKIFTDERSNAQTSQIFAVTHSPFIIHNENRKNDKVLVLKKSDDGIIFVSDRPEYYKCDSVAAVEDAFSIRNFYVDVNTVFLEGRTDEKYFNKVLEVFDYKDVPIKFKWIGHFDNRNQEQFTGSGSLKQAYNFLIGQNLNNQHIFLFDCDTNHANEDNDKLHARLIPQFDNSKEIKKGIENALVLDNIDLNSFYTKKETVGDYGEVKIVSEFKKMECCEYICALDDDTLQKVFVNLKVVVDDMIAICEPEGKIEGHE